MPQRPADPTNETDLWNSILARLRALERMLTEVPLQEVVEQLEKLSVRAYSWQSTFTLVTGLGHKLCADRDGMIKFVRAERSAGDGTTEAEFDVYLNGTTIFGGELPTVPVGEILGPEVIPDTATFHKGDTFQVDVLDTGGGSGPLRVTIHFIEDLEDE